ncbi:MAG: hypothetical protein EoVTN8_621 [Fluviibacter phosphoraccumulans EoVTN8]
MGIKSYFALAVIATGCLFSAPAMSLDNQSVLEQRICENLKAASEQVLDDTRDTTKYLSPYIAAEIYEQVVAKSVEAVGGASAGMETPRMAQLPCGDTVSTFLMSIKKRMEFNRMDYFLARYRFWIIGALIMGLLGGLFYRRLNRHSMQ